MGPCPQNKKAVGGPGSIAEQQVDHHVDVLLGGGRNRFSQTIDGGPYTGQTVIQSAQAQGYTVITTSAQLQKVQPGRKVLGLFTGGNMSQEWIGKLATPDPGTGPQRCMENQRPANEPSLSVMTQKALQLLETRSDEPERAQGFFLQVEGASIDKRDHAADPCGQIGETVAFDRAIQIGLNYAATHSDTLVVITADHAHTSQIIPVEAHSPGLSATLITEDNALMKISYATNTPGQSQEHTGAQVRIAAQGPNSQRVLGVTNQTDLFYTLAEALGVGHERPGR